MPDPRATAVVNRLAALYPELAQQLQGEEVVRMISQKLGREDGWTYLPEEPTQGGIFLVSTSDEATWTGEARYDPSYPDGYRWLGNGHNWHVFKVYAWKPKVPAPLTAEARAYLEGCK